MKLTSKITLTLLLSIIISCDKCKKDPPPEPQICEINGEVFDSEKGRQQMMDYMYFKVGTWWVYEEETTGALDTITVFYNTEGIENNYHWFVCNTYSSYTTYNYKYEYHESFTGGCASNSACRCHKVERSKGQIGDFVGANRDFFFPAQEGDFQYIASGTLDNPISSIINISEVFVLNDLDFNNVVEYDVEWCFSEGTQPANFWLAEHVGIIKKELVDDQEIWNLIDYNIVQ